MIASITREISPLEAIVRSGFNGSPGFGEKSNSTASKPFHSRLFPVIQPRFEFGLFESEIGEVSRMIVGKLWARPSCAICGGFAGRFICAPTCSISFCQPLQLGVASFDLAHSLLCAFAEFDYFRDRTAVFAF